MGCCIIPLTKGFRAIVDPEVWVRIPRTGWRAKKARGGWYALRIDQVNGRKRYTYMHRLIMSCPKGMITHHIHGDTLDNRISELQNMTPGEHEQLSRMRRIARLA